MTKNNVIISITAGIVWIIVLIIIAKMLRNRNRRGAEELLASRNFVDI